MPSAQEQTVEGNSSSSSSTAAGRNDTSGGGDVARGKDQPGTMFHAAKMGDADFIQSEILNGADVNAKDTNGERYDATIPYVTAATIGCVRVHIAHASLAAAVQQLYDLWLTHPYPRMSAFMLPSKILPHEDECWRCRLSNGIDSPISSCTLLLYV